MDNLVNRLAAKMAKGGLSQTQVASALGVGQNAVSYWLSGQRSPRGLSRKAIKKWLDRGEK